jgi:hypothetical protein
MSIDYISLNKACPKNEYPMPHICQIVDSTTLCKLLAFLDAYLVYHQINIVIDDEKNIVHHTFWDLLIYQDGIRAEE